MLIGFRDENLLGNTQLRVPFFYLVTAESLHKYALNRFALRFWGIR